MGSGQSARKLTISNEEEVGVIKVSNAIIQRLAQSERPGISESSSEVKPSTPIKHTVTPNTAAVEPPSSKHPLYYFPELTMSAHQIQQQKEQELKEQEQYWQNRLLKLEDNYQKINHILEDEYKKAASETLIATKNGQKVADIQGRMQPCLENNNKVLKCLQDHPKEILKCSSLVEEFSNCVWNVHYTCVIDICS